MRVAVTGANGYLGGWVCRELVGRGHEVLRLPGRTTEGWDTADSCDALVHLAWFASPGEGSRDLQATSLERTETLFDQDWDGRPVVFASTCAVYGPYADAPGYARLCAEEDRCDPQCDYSFTKRVAEISLATITNGRGCSLRFGSLMGVGVPGGRTRTDLVVNAFAQDAYATGRVEVWSPETVKPVIHVRDAAGLIGEAVDGRWRGVYNAASACVRALDIATIVSLQTGALVTTVEGPDGTGRSCRVDMRRTSERLPNVLWRGIAEAAREFEGRSPTDADKNRPWVLS